MKSREKMRRSSRSAIVAIAAALATAILASPAGASVNVSEFSVGSSSQQAGGHPDLTARFKVDKPGEPEVINNVYIKLNQGVFGNPGSIYKCRAAVFVENECQPGAQAGLITLVANYEGDPNYVLGTTPIYNMQVLGDEAARLAFVVPVLNVPVIMPINVRSDSDYGLQISIDSIAQNVALSSAFLTVWGFPGDKEHDAPGLPGRAHRQLHRSALPACRRDGAAVHRQSQRLFGKPAESLGRRDDLSGPQPEPAR
jgi:hypothetical protein